MPPATQKIARIVLVVTVWLGSARGTVQLLEPLVPMVPIRAAGAVIENCGLEEPLTWSVLLALAPPQLICWLSVPVLLPVGMIKVPWREGLFHLK